MKRRSQTWLWALVPVCFVLFSYALIGSAGQGGRWPTYMTYYDWQAEGFRSGHLYIPVAPAPQLLAKADPYDPSNSQYWLGDATLYKGRYYMYWGPVPGLLQAAAKSVLAIHGLIGDQYLAFSGFALSALFGALVIERAARRLFAFVPGWLRALLIVAFAFANPAPHLVATGGVYQAAIGFGQAFALGGLVLAFDAVCAAPATKVAWQVPAAGAVWALANASRIGLLPVTALFGLLTALACAWPAQRRWLSLIMNLTAVAAPLTVGLGLLLLYNKLRFDQWTEFGTNLQLSGFKFRLSKEYWLSNLYSYTLRPFVSDCHFPFAMAPWFPGRNAFPEGTEVPAGYLINEPVVGWLRVVPITWLLVIVPAAFMQRLRLMRERSWLRAPHLPAFDRAPRAFLWLSACLAVLAGVTGLLVMGLYMATMRYLADVTNGLVLLGVLGAFSVIDWAHSRSQLAQVLVRLLSSALALVTIAFGALLGYQGYTGHFKTFNPELNAKLIDALSVCDDGSAGHPKTVAPRRRRR